MKRHQLQALIGTLLLTGLLSAIPAVSNAQEVYPSRNIRMIVGYATGTGPDILARFISEAIKKASGKTVIVENKPGALTNIAAQAVASAKPDGYTVFITAGNSTFAANPWLFKSVPFDPIKDFTPVTSLIKTPFAFAVPVGSPINSVAELTRVLKAKGTKANYAYANSISLAASELYKHKTGVEAQGVGYKSIPDSHAALAAGDVDFFVSDLTFVLGPKPRAKILALTVAERSPVVPEIPSSKEAGLEGFDLGAWWGIWLPAGAPQNVVDTLADIVDAAVGAEESLKFFATLGNQPWKGVRGEALRQYTIDEMKKWGEAIKIAKVEPQ